MADQPMYTYHIAQKMLAVWQQDPDRMRKLLSRDNGFPAKHVMANLAAIPDTVTHHGRVHQLMRKIRRMLSQGIGVVISGPKGAGKTSIACIMSVEAAKYGVEAHFIQAVDAVKTMRSFARDPLEDIIRRIHLLVLDDVTEKVIDAPELETLIRDRSSNDLSTFITTNIAPATFKLKNPMLWELIAEICLPIEVDPRMHPRGVAKMPEDDEN